jgi:hypothetical protein
MTALAFADFRAGRYRGAQHIAGRQLRYAVFFDQTLRLGPLARTRRSQKY